MDEGSGEKRFFIGEHEVPPKPSVNPKPQEHSPQEFYLEYPTPPKTPEGIALKKIIDALSSKTPQIGRPTPEAELGKTLTGMYDTQDREKLLQLAKPLAETDNKAREAIRELFSTYVDQEMRERIERSARVKLDLQEHDNEAWELIRKATTEAVVQKARDGIGKKYGPEAVQRFFGPEPGTSTTPPPNTLIPPQKLPPRQ